MFWSQEFSIEIFLDCKVSVVKCYTLAGTCEDKERFEQSTDKWQINKFQGFIAGFAGGCVDIRGQSSQTIALEGSGNNIL